jgi:hypothetical protein
MKLLLSFVSPLDMLDQPVFGFEFLLFLFIQRFFEGDDDLFEFRMIRPFEVGVHD